MACHDPEKKKQVLETSLDPGDPQMVGCRHIFQPFISGHFLNSRPAKIGRKRIARNCAVDSCCCPKKIHEKLTASPPENGPTF